MAIELVELSAEARAAACVLPDGRRGVPQPDGGCLFACTVGDVMTRGGKIESITDKGSCCAACDEPQADGLPWWLLLVAAAVGYKLGGG